jgi:hypothetical protein
MNTNNLQNDPNQISTSNMDSDEISLKELILKLQEWWKYLLSKWLFIVIAMSLGAIGGFIYASMKKPLYIAELTFVLDDGKQESALGNYAGIASQFGFNLGGEGGKGVFEGQNLLTFMLSRSMIERTLLTTVDVKGKKETLAEFYININRLRKKWIKANSKLQNIRFLPGASPSEFTLEQSSLIGSIYGDLVERYLVVGVQNKKSSFLSVKVTSNNELFSKYFAEALVKVVSDFYVDTKIKKSLNNVTILKHQVDSVRGKFNSAVSGVASAIDANPNPNRARQSLGVPTQRKQVDAQANQAMLIELMKNLAISQISLREETPLIQVIDRPVLPLPKIIFTQFKGVISGVIWGALIMIFLLITIRVFKNIMA